VSIPAFPWQPLEGPQRQAHTTEADVTGYGGAAGGGKTDLLIGTSLTAHERSIIYRREIKQVRAIHERSEEIIGTQGRYNGTLLIWRNLPGGKTLEFGGAGNLQEAKRYQGRPHDFIGFDEATEIPESVYRFLTGWNRTTTPGQRCRIILTFNPPQTEEGRWVVRYFAPWIDPDYPGERANSGEIRHFAQVDGKEAEVSADHPHAQSRTFIFARLSDNPYLEATGYRQTLEALPEPLRSQLLMGDFEAGMGDDPWQIIPREWVKLAQQRWQQRAQPEVTLTAMGVDVARGGRDKTVIARRFQNWIAPLESFPGSDTPDGPSVAAQVLRLHEGDAVVNVDVIGVGSSVYDFVKERVRANGVNAAEKSEKTDKSGRLTFANKRAELWWLFREALDPQTGDDLALPPDQELLADLCAPIWTLRSNGIQVESKQDLLKRLDRSPDRADAVILATMGEVPWWVWGL
jgi:hypothetical protein